MTIESDIQKLDPGKIIVLYVLDATVLGGAINRFHSGANEINASVVWQANTYQPWPIIAEGFDKTTKGKSPRPRLKVANPGGVITDIAALYQDLVDASLTRKRTFVKYLDAVNFPGGVNPDADPNVEFPDDVFSVNRKVADNKKFIEFELSAACDVSGVKLPRRQVVQNICQWVYRSSECSYAGGAVAKLDDTPTADPNLDKCGKRLASCELRFGENQPLPFGAFPGVGLIQ